MRIPEGRPFEAIAHLLGSAISLAIAVLAAVAIRVIDSSTIWGQ